MRRPPDGWRDEGLAEEGLEASGVDDIDDDDESETSAGMGLIVRLTKAPAPGQGADPAEPRLRIAPIQRPPDDPQSLDDEELELLDERDEDTQDESADQAAAPLQIRISALREEPTDEVGPTALAAGFPTDEPPTEQPISSDEALPWRSLPEGATVLGRYRIERQIVDPSAYASYVAVQEPMVRRVMLTLLRGADVLPDASVEDRALLEERFLADASAISGLRHPHVARVLDFGQAKDGTCYAISELVHGLTLAEILGRGRMPPQRSIGAMVHVARGLAAIHDAGLVHKNLTADQVVLELEGSRDKARLRPPAMGMDRLPPSSRIDSGNANVQAPEVLAGDQPSAASDVYSFGVLLYRAVHGSYPFEGATADAVATSQRNGLTMPADGGTARVDALIQRCLAEVSVRNVSAFEIIEELREIGDIVPAVEPVPAPSGFKVPETVPPMPSTFSPPSMPPQGTTFTLMQAFGITLVASLSSVALAMYAGREWFPPEVQRIEVPVPVLTPAPAPAPAPAPVVVEPTPAPPPVEVAKAETPRPASKSSRRNTSRASAPPPPVEVAPVVVQEPVTVQKPVEPVEVAPVPPPSPSQLLSGSWVGRAGNTALNFQLSVDRNGLIGGTAKLVDGSTSGAREGAVRGRVTQNSDGTWKMELSMTSGGVTTTYSGVLAGDQATGKVSEDGKNKGKFVLAR